MTFVDTNVIIDVLTNDPTWADWSLQALGDAAAASPLTINAVVLTELSPGFATLRQLTDKLAELSLNVLPFGDEEAFCAGKVFAEYRRNKDRDAPTKVLPDFMIGAHAIVSGLSLFTRDAALYRRYFPSLPLITPETEHG